MEEEEGGGGIRKKRSTMTGEEVDYKNKSGTAWSHSYLNQKPWHPLSYPNQRRKWIAEQTDAQRQRRAEEVAKEFAQEQEFFRQTALVSKKEKEKVEMMKAVSFMYVRPPGYNAESAKAAELEDERKTMEPTSQPDLPPPETAVAGPEKKKSRPKDVFGRTLPTEEEFEVLKNAPRMETGLPARVKPFGIEIRNVKCARCGAFGHQSGDRECPLKDAIMPNEQSRLQRDDPLTSILAHTGSIEPLKWELKQKPGMSPPRGGFKPDDPNQQIVAEDIFDEYGGFLSGGGIPELLTSFSLDKLRKHSRSKTKKKNRLLSPSDSDADREKKKLKVKREKHKKFGQSDSSDSSNFKRYRENRYSRSKRRLPKANSDDNSDKDQLSSTSDSDSDRERRKKKETVTRERHKQKHLDSVDIPDFTRYGESRRAKREKHKKLKQSDLSDSSDFKRYHENRYSRSKRKLPKASLDDNSDKDQYSSPSDSDSDRERRKKKEMVARERHKQKHLDSVDFSRYHESRRRLPKASLDGNSDKDQFSSPSDSDPDRERRKKKEMVVGERHKRKHLDSVDIADFSRQRESRRQLSNFSPSDNLGRDRTSFSSDSDADKEKRPKKETARRENHKKRNYSDSSDTSGFNKKRENKNSLSISSSPEVSYSEKHHQRSKHWQRHHDNQHQSHQPSRH